MLNQLCMKLQGMHFVFISLNINISLRVFSRIYADWLDHFQGDKRRFVYFVYSIGPFGK